MSVPTPHIESEKGHIAKTVLMPGDPLRAKFIADTFLTDPVLVNNVRGVQGHTGTWNGVPVTVMASGMGIPAIGIYSWELFNFYDVDNIIRIGSAGALQDDIKVMDIVAAQGACTNSNYINQFNCPGTFAPIADYTLLSKAVEAAHEHGVDIKVGNIVSNDTFYAAEGTNNADGWRRMGALAVRDGGRRALRQRRLRPQACAVHLHDLRPYLPRRGSLLRAAPDLLHPYVEIALDTAVKMAQL